MGFGGGGGRLATFADLSFSACRAFFLALMALWESKVKFLCSVHSDEIQHVNVFLANVCDVAHRVCISWSLNFWDLSSFRASR